MRMQCHRTRRPLFSNDGGCGHEKDGQISFGYGFPKLSQKDNTDLEEARVNIAPVTGKTMESCVQTHDSRLEKLADCNHMKVLVFGKI